MLRRLLARKSGLKRIRTAVPKRRLTYIQHAYSAEQARIKFQEAEKKRFFAPIQLESKRETKAVTPFKDPLKQVLAPCYGVNVTVSSSYEGEYGIRQSETTTSTDDKGNVTTTTKEWIDWYDINGSLGTKSYSQENVGMTIYAGFSWKASDIENALEGYRFSHNLLPFEASTISKEIYIDPFLKRSATAQDEANSRVRSKEEDRAHADIARKSGYSDTRVNRCRITYHQSSLNTYLLPAYILQYTNRPPQILPALSEKDDAVYGPLQYSIMKCAAAGAAVASVISAFVAPITIPMRVGGIAAVTALSAAWAKYQGGNLQYRFQQVAIEDEMKHNQTVAETIADQKRFQETARNFPENPQQDLHLDAEFYKTLGLDSSKPVTREMVSEAFNQKIKEAHPDKQGGNTEQTRHILQARAKFNNALGGKRSFATYAPIPRKAPVKVPPRSVFDPHAEQLITRVIDKQDYKGALVLVKEKNAHPDGHCPNENTLVTEIAKRGTVKDLAFAVDVLGCSVDTSCDCPVHNTGLHYAAERGDANMIRELIKRKATVNLINSHGETALDVAEKHGKKAAQTLLIQQGGIKHTTLPGLAGLFVRAKGSTIGYKPDDRTLLSNVETSTVILLDDGKKTPSKSK